LTLEAGGVSATARGHVSALVDLSSLGVDVEARGPDASVVGSWIGVAGLPPRPFEIRGRMRRQRDLSRLSLDDVRLRVGVNEIAVGGGVGPPPRCEGTELAVAASGRDLSELSALTRLVLPSRPFTLRGRLLRRPDGWALSGAEARIADTSLRADG